MSEGLNKAHAKAQKKKIIILAAMVLGTGVTWSKALFGKDDKPTAPPVVAATTNGTPSIPAPAAQSAAVATTSVIATYEQAVQRMDLWPQALDRQVHIGLIEELTPINDLLGNENSLDFELEEENLSEATPYLSPEIPTVVEEENVAFSTLRLRLTTTAHFGKSSYAVISGDRVKSGESVEVQVAGKSVRYEVRAIGTRMVEVAYQGTTHILRIDLADLQHRNQDGD